MLQKSFCVTSRKRAQNGIPGDDPMANKDLPGRATLPNGILSVVHYIRRQIDFLPASDFMHCNKPQLSNTSEVHADAPQCAIARPRFVRRMPHVVGSAIHEPICWESVRAWPLQNLIFPRIDSAYSCHECPSGALHHGDGGVRHRSIGGPDTSNARHASARMGGANSG